ncbi:hypothetical protein EVB91_065 [Rhizobium phage RHph_I1_18]|nr:hypothetical protein EVB91_065 [Rhizobium phage RHph_I1_18]
MAKPAPKYGQFMEDLSEISKQVWAATTLEAKRNLLLRACATFKYKEQGENIKRAIMKETKLGRLDEIAANIALNKDNRVLGPIKR